MNLKELLEIISKIQITGNTIYEYELLEYYKAELLKLGKFKVGDAVELRKTPVINNKYRWGWLAYKSVLVKGAHGVVLKVDHMYGNFRYDIKFADADGYFCFEESFLRPLTNNKGE